MLPTPPGLDAALADRYTLQAVLGTGGTSTVYRARDEKHARDVAIKVLRPELAASLTRQRFARESSIVAKLQHPHILALIDSGRAADTYYFVMPLVEGVTLRDRLLEGEAPDIAEVTRILADLADALAYAHERGVVHRDLKPSNVLLTGRHALLMDFGVAKSLLEGQQNPLTVGIALGTPAYMSPEQAMALPTVDHRADLYALGVLGYELLAGHPPFPGGAPQDILAAHVSRPPEDLGVLRPDAPEPLRELVMRCLEKDPAARWPDASTIVERLDALVTPSGGTTPHAGLPPERRAPARLRRMLTLAAAALAVAAITFVGTRDRGPEPISLQRQQITFEGNVVESAISADGQWLAYVSSDSLGQALFVRDMSATTALELDRGPEVAGLVWSEDGSEIAYHAGGANAVVRAVPRLGGAGRVLGRGHWLPSPDLRRLVLANPGAKDLTVVDRTTGDTVRLERPEWVTFSYGIAWAPDSRRFAIEVARPADGIHAILLAYVEPEASAIVEAVRDSAVLSEPSFSHDGRLLYYIRRPAGGRPDLMRIEIDGRRRPHGDPQLVVEDFDGSGRHGLYASRLLNRVTHTRDGEIVYLRTEGESNVWAFDVGGPLEPPKPRSITTGSAVHTDVRFSADGRRLALVRATRVERTVGLLSAEGGPFQPLATTAVSVEAAWSRNDERLAFGQGPTRRDLRIVVYDLENGASRVVSQTEVGADLTWAGGRVVAQGSGNRRLLSIDAESGQAETLVPDTVGFNFRPRASPDGRRLAFFRNRAVRGIWLQDLAGSEPARLVLAADMVPLRFDESGEVLYLTDDGLRDDTPRRVLRLSLSDGELSTVMTLPRGFVVEDISLDGRHVVATRIEWRGDVWRLASSGR